MPECCDLTHRLDSLQRRCVEVQEQPAGLDLLALLAAIQAVAECIDHAHEELSRFWPEDILGRHLPTVTDELDAIISHTEAATTTILEACETLEQAVATTPAQPAVTAATARIYEACSFQDITGQHMAKVGHTLKLVEARVAAVLHVFGCLSAGDRPTASPVTLLNGPQPPQHAMTQVAVDALLDGFE